MPSSGAQHSWLPIMVTATDTISYAVQARNSPGSVAWDKKVSPFSWLLQGTKTQFSIPYTIRVVSKVLVNTLQGVQLLS